MNKEPTERELKMVEHMKALMTMLSLMAIFIDGVFKWAQWYSDGQDKLPFQLREKQQEILDFLSTEFDVKYTIFDRNAGKEEDGKQS